MDIKIIKTKKDYHIALKRLESLMEAKKGTHEFDELELLALVIEDYEKKHFTVADTDPIDALKFYMSQNGLTNKDLEDVIGNKGRVSDVLNRKRELSKTMIRAIARKFPIPVEILMKEYPISPGNRHDNKHHKVVAAG